MSNSTRKWIRGAFEILIHGGAAALIVGIGTMGNDDISWAMWRRIVLTSFIGNGGLRFVQYFANNPLPPEGDTTIFTPGQLPVTGQAVISINPLSKVQSIPAVPEPPKP